MYDMYVWLTICMYPRYILHVCSENEVHVHVPNSVCAHTHINTSTAVLQVVHNMYVCTLIYFNTCV